MCTAAGVVIPTGRNKSFNAFGVFKELDKEKIPQRLKDIIENLFA